MSKKVPKRERKQNTHTFTALVFKLDFEVPLRDFDANCIRNVSKTRLKTTPFRGHVEHEKLRFDFAGASGSRVGPSRKPKENRENAT